MKLIFASSNKNKFIEIEKIIPKNIELRNLKEINFFEEIPENEDTIEGNATFKAKYIHCLLYTSPSPRDVEESRMPSSA